MRRCNRRFANGKRATALNDAGEAEAYEAERVALYKDMVSNNILWPFASLKGPKKTDAFKARRAKGMPRGPHSRIDFMGPTYLKKWKQPDVPYEKFRKLFNFASEKLRGAAEDVALAHGAEPSQGGGPSKIGGATVSGESVPDSVSVHLFPGRSN